VHAIYFPVDVTAIRIALLYARLRAAVREFSARSFSRHLPGRTGQSLLYGRVGIRVKRISRASTKETRLTFSAIFRPVKHAVAKAWNLCAERDGDKMTGGYLWKARNVVARIYVNYAKLCTISGGYTSQCGSNVLRDYAGAAKAENVNGMRKFRFTLLQLEFATSCGNSRTYVILFQYICIFSRF